MKRLRKNIAILILLLSCFAVCRLNAQEDSIYNKFLRFNDLYYKGSIGSAEKIMLDVFDSLSALPESYQIAFFNNMGLIKKSYGFYDEALTYFDKADSLAQGGKENLKALAFIYNNKSRIFTFRRSYPKAVEYLEKSVRIYQSLENQDRSVKQSLSTAYLNLGIIYNESGNYNKAFENLGKSLDLKVKNNLSELELTCLNLAKTYSGINNLKKAEEYYNMSLNTIYNKFGHDYYRLIDVYFGYSDFLFKAGRYDEALQTDREALNICVRNYGKKHPLLSMAFEHLGDFYRDRLDYPAALEYYQQSLIAAVTGFNDPSILSNPSLDSTVLNIRLLDVLKKKTQALELYSSLITDTLLKLDLLKSGLSANDLALKLIDRLRSSYLTEESRIYLAENEKETYLSAIHNADLLYDLTVDYSMLVRMYNIVQTAKSAVLRNEIIEDEAFISAGVPDSLWKRKNDLAIRIAAYNNLLSGLTLESAYDSITIAGWKDDIFRMNREMETLHAEINREYPQYDLLIRDTEAVKVGEISKQMNRKETIIDFFLSDNYNNGRRTLYTFIIKKKGVQLFETLVDSSFMANASLIRDAFRKPGSKPFEELTGALFYMYGVLIKPVERMINGNKLIIIPDEEIAWIPFDALISKKPVSGQRDFEGLRFLVNRYSVSYCFSSSLIFSKNYRTGRMENVVSFAPYYGAGKVAGDLRAELPGTVAEIRSIYRYFRGKAYYGESATESNFKLEGSERSVFHLAMHSVTDSTDSRFSYLVFDRTSDPSEDGKLYNYEISLSRIRSPMVVLSACNSGTGTLYHGEGLISLARAFRLAGALSIVRTSWEVNDETSADIISFFYRQLSKGRDKDEALRSAKLDYLKSSPPAYSDPYYWAAYEIYGSNEPVIHKNHILFIAVVLAGLIATALLIDYLRRRRTPSDRFL